MQILKNVSTLLSVYDEMVKSVAMVITDIFDKARQTLVKRVGSTSMLIN
jgi:hypothetical protein